MAEAMDWRGPASAEYRSKRAALVKKLATESRAEIKAKERREKTEREIADLDAGARAFGLTDVSITSTAADESAGRAAIPAEAEMRTEPPAAEGQSARQIILMALEMAYPKGLRAAALKKIIERELGREVHYKTPGMTLYRLQEQEIVRREGYDWFLAEAPPRWVPDPEPDPDDFDGDDEPDWALVQHQEDMLMDRK